MSQSLNNELQHKIDQKTKPLGSLGQLEAIGKQIGFIQNTLSPNLQSPHILVFAGDHGVVTNSSVSLYPQEVTCQMVLNFLNGGAAINVFCRQHNIKLLTIDAGVKGDFETDNPGLIHQKIRPSTRDYSKEKAMTTFEVNQAIDLGKKIVHDVKETGCNIIGFGEMGIGNTSSASLIMHSITGIPLSECVGKGTGLDDEGVKHKYTILQQALNLHGIPQDPIAILACYGGYEIAQQCGAIIAAANKGMVILIDGFITTSALLIASQLHPEVLSFCIASHQSDESGHKKMLSFLSLQPVLKLGLRLGEGTGCALAYPIIESSINFINEMASFEQAGISKNT